MTTKPRAHEPTPDEEPDPDFERLLETVETDPAARAAYEDTIQRAALLAEGVAARKHRRLSQKALAAIMGTTQSAVSDLESGRVEPQLSTLQRYARALGRRLHFTIADQALHNSWSDALLQQLKEAALSPLLTTLVRQSEEQGQTLQTLADALLLPQRVIWPLLRMLQAEGWTRSEGKGSEQRFSLIEAAANVIGVSIEHDRVVAVLMDMDGDLIRETSISLPDSTSPTVIGVITDAVEALYGRSDRRVLGIGVSVAGLVEAATGKVRFAPDLQSDADPWAGVALEEELQANIQERLGNAHVLVAVENDANALAAWEYLRRGDESVAVMLLSGAGIGMGYVVEGRLVHGYHSAAGEGGHVIVDENGPQCRAGLPHRGCLETMISAQGILSSLGLPSGTASERATGLIAANERISCGDGSAGEVFVSAGRHLGKFLARTILLFDPARVTFYADPYLARQEHASASAFHDGLRLGLEECASSRLQGVGEPRLEWHALEDQTGAVAAGAAALWHFLKKPMRWHPGFLAADLRTWSPESEGAEFTTSETPAAAERVPA